MFDYILCDCNTFTRCECGCSIGYESDNNNLMLLSDMMFFIKIKIKKQNEISNIE